MAREVELKFETDAGARDLILDSGVLDGAKARRVKQETVYFDTPRGSVRRRGFSLRIRRTPKGCVQTVKHRAGSPAGLFSRDEWETETDGLALDFEAIDATPLGEALTPAMRAKLRPIASTSFVRTIWRLDRGGSRIEAVLDEGEVIAGKASVPLTELELELVKGDTSDLFELAEQVGRVVPLRLGVMSKAERGFALAEGRLDEAARAEPVRLAPEMRVCDAFAAAAHSCLRHFRLNEPLILARGDAEALHQVRVAIRRLRSALTLFRPTIADWEYERMRDALRRLAGELGEARNLDVLIAGAKMGKVAREKLGRKREAAYRRVSATLESGRTRGLMLDLIRWFETGGWRARSRAEKPIGPFARDRLARRWKKVAKRGAKLGELDAARLHSLRLDVKKMRYSAEFTAGLYESGAAAARMERFVEALKSLQDRLGEVNDAETAREVLGARKAAAGDDKAARRLIEAAEAAYCEAEEAAGYWD